MSQHQATEQRTVDVNVEQVRQEGNTIKGHGGLREELLEHPEPEERGDDPDGAVHLLLGGHRSPFSQASTSSMLKVARPALPSPATTVLFSGFTMAGRPWKHDGQAKRFEPCGMG